MHSAPGAKSSCTGTMATAETSGNLLEVPFRGGASRSATTRCQTWPGPTAVHWRCHVITLHRGKLADRHISSARRSSWRRCPLFAHQAECCSNCWTKPLDSERRCQICGRHRRAQGEVPNLLRSDTPMRCRADRRGVVEYWQVGVVLWDAQAGTSSDR